MNGVEASAGIPAALTGSGGLRSLTPCSWTREALIQSSLWSSLRSGARLQSQVSESPGLCPRLQPASRGVSRWWPRGKPGRNVEHRLDTSHVQGASQRTSTRQARAQAPPGSSTPACHPHPSGGHLMQHPLCRQRRGCGCSGSRSGPRVPRRGQTSGGCLGHAVGEGRVVPRKALCRVPGSLIGVQCLVSQQLTVACNFQGKLHPQVIEEV